MVRTAKSKKGSAYQYGSKGPRKFDCSGLVYYSFKQMGITLPASSSAQSRLGKAIDLSDAKPGDLIFYRKNGQIFHVSIITKNRRDRLNVVHSTTSGGVIEQDILASTYWRPKIYKIISLADAIK